MKSSYILLIIGAGLLVAGLAIASVSVFAVTKQVLEGGAVIGPTNLEPGQSEANTLKDLPTGRQLILSLDTQPRGIALNATITGPDGGMIGTYNITQTPFTTTLLTKQAGDHTLEIKNAGNASVRISGALLNSPVAQQSGGVSLQNDPGMQSLVTYGIGVLSGIVLIVAGIVVLIIGAVKYFRSRNSTASVPTD